LEPIQKKKKFQKKKMLAPNFLANPNQTTTSFVAAEPIKSGKVVGLDSMGRAQLFNSQYSTLDLWNTDFSDAVFHRIFTVDDHTQILVGQTVNNMLFVTLLSRKEWRTIFPWKENVALSSAEYAHDRLVVSAGEFTSAFGFDFDAWTISETPLFTIPFSQITAMAIEPETLFVAGESNQKSLTFQNLHLNVASDRFLWVAKWDMVSSTWEWVSTLDVQTRGTLTEQNIVAMLKVETQFYFLLNRLDAHEMALLSFFDEENLKFGREQFYSLVSPGAMCSDRLTNTCPGSETPQSNKAYVTSLFAPDFRQGRVSETGEIHGTSLSLKILYDNSNGLDWNLSRLLISGYASGINIDFRGTLQPLNAVTTQGFFAEHRLIPATDRLYQPWTRVQTLPLLISSQTTKTDASVCLKALQVAPNDERIACLANYFTQISESLFTLIVPASQPNLVVPASQPTATTAQLLSSSKFTGIKNVESYKSFAAQLVFFPNGNFRGMQSPLDQNMLAKDLSFKGVMLNRKSATKTYAVQWILDDHDFVGIAQNDANTAAEVIVLTLGASPAQQQLVPGKSYYTTSLGNMAVKNGSKKIGVALSPTLLQIQK
jgi:hypothetical protein